MGVETVEPVGPFGVGAAEPVVHRKQTLELKLGRAALAVAGPNDEAGPLQNLEVLGDGRLRERGGLCELDDAGSAGGEAFKDRAAVGFGKGCEGAAQEVIGTHYHQDI